MAKHKMVQSNLLKNSISAYFAAIEIHNKPNILYRYETVTLLIMNAWELLLKTFVRRYIKDKSIYENDNHTISFDKAITYTNDFINTIKPKKFVAVKENLIKIEEYRNSIVHFYNEALEPYIFMLVARSALNFVEFVKEYFSKDIISDEGLFIMPLGFKLPFKPEDFLSKNVANYKTSEESRKFIESIVEVVENLKEQDIEDSIVLGFDIYLESVKKLTNSDLLVAITSKEQSDASFAKVTQARFSNDPNAQVYNMSDNEFRSTWKYTYKDIVNWCKENIDGFKQNAVFNNIKREIKSDINCVYTRKLDSQNSKSVSQDFYTDYALERIKEEYEKRRETK